MKISPFHLNRCFHLFHTLMDAKNYGEAKKFFGSMIVKIDQVLDAKNVINMIRRLNEIEIEAIEKIEKKEKI